MTTQARARAREILADTYSETYGGDNEMAAIIREGGNPSIPAGCVLRAIETALRSGRASIADKLRQIAPTFQPSMNSEAALNFVADRLEALSVDECSICDGDGRIWNNADPTSGQFLDCECTIPTLAQARGETA